jgi:hypothetical protein
MKNHPLIAKNRAPSPHHYFHGSPFLQKFPHHHFHTTTFSTPKVIFTKGWKKWRGSTQSFGGTF